MGSPQPPASLPGRRDPVCYAELPAASGSRSPIHPTGVFRVPITVPGFGDQQVKPHMCCRWLPLHSPEKACRLLVERLNASFQGSLCRGHVLSCIRGIPLKLRADSLGSGRWGPEQPQRPCSWEETFSAGWPLSSVTMRTCASLD